MKTSSANWNWSRYQHLNHLEKCPKIFLKELLICPFQWKIVYLFLCWGIDLLQSSLDSSDSTCGIYDYSLGGICPFPLDFFWDRKKNLRWCPCKPLSYRCLQTVLPGRILCPRQVLVVLCIHHSLTKKSLNICCVSSTALSWLYEKTNKWENKTLLQCLSSVLEGSGCIQSMKPLENGQIIISRGSHVNRSPWWPNPARSHRYSNAGRPLQEKNPWKPIMLVPGKDKVSPDEDAEWHSKV